MLIAQLSDEMKFARFVVCGGAGSDYACRMEIYSSDWVHVVVGQDLISQLLERDPAKRLGAHAGAEEIKAHPFYESINWALLRNTRPPYIPRRNVRKGTPSPAAEANFGDF